MVEVIYHPSLVFQVYLHASFDGRSKFSRLEMKWYSTSPDACSSMSRDLYCRLVIRRWLICCWVVAAPALYVLSQSREWTGQSDTNAGGVTKMVLNHRSTRPFLCVSVITTVWWLSAVNLMIHFVTLDVKVTEGLCSWMTSNNSIAREYGPETKTKWRPQVDLASRN